ncbi:MAG: hypothetical protein COB73_00775 [Flavobacteriaceae bacterium]|nr:MAG: hypothetical protein COB73_00775 [Flavobacteriaceae bacterium]
MDSKKIAQAHFKNNQEAKEIFVTSDGQAFVSGNYADLHANSNREGKKMKIVSFKTAEFETVKSLTAPERIAFINALETEAEVVEALEGETAKTVKEAGAKKIEELTKTE